MDFIPGFAQGTVRVLISYPFDYLKTHLQMNKTPSIKEFVKNNSIKSVYRGASLSLMTIPVERAIQYKLYETFNKKMNPFGSGIICGAISSCISLPMNSVINNYILNEKEKNLREYLKNTVKTNSVKSYFYGYKPELMRSTLSTTIYLGVYGNMRNRFGNDGLQCAINSSVAGVSLWTFAYPFETLKIEQQTNGNLAMIDVVKTRVNEKGVFNMWRGILPVYVRTLPSSVAGMLVYEKMRELLSLK